MTTERTDHTQAALGWRELVNDQYESGHPDHEKVMEYATLMQASATLALVEQQRTANVLKIEELSIRAQGWQPPLDVAATLDVEGVQS